MANYIDQFKQNNVIYEVRDKEARTLINNFDKQLQSTVDEAIKNAKIPEEVAEQVSQKTATLSEDIKDISSSLTEDEQDLQSHKKIQASSEDLGHVRILNEEDTKEDNSGKVYSTKYINDLAVKPHASNDTKYGAANNDSYGHVKTYQGSLKSSDNQSEVPTVQYIYQIYQDWIEGKILGTSSMSSLEEGKIIQYLGNDSGYNKGWFYKCVKNTETEELFWEPLFLPNENFMLENLSNVIINDETLAEGQYLRYNSEKGSWENRSGSGGGTDVEANPTGEASAELNTIKIDDVIYSVTGGGSSSIMPNPEEDAGDSLKKIKIDDTVYSIDGITVEANPSVSSGDSKLNSIKIGSANYRIESEVTSVNNKTGAVNITLEDLGGVAVSANNTTTSTTELKNIKIGNNEYIIPESSEGQIIQVKAFPEPSEEYKDTIYQYIGETNDNYTNGYFYKCINISVTKTVKYLGYKNISSNLGIKEDTQVGDHLYSLVDNNPYFGIMKFDCLNNWFLKSEGYWTWYSYKITSISDSEIQYRMVSNTIASETKPITPGPEASSGTIWTVSRASYLDTEREETVEGYAWQNIKVQAGGGSGGTDDYNDLEHKPKINGVTLSGDKTLEDLGINLSTKVNIEQGIEAAGKILKVNDEGNLELAEDAGGSEVSVSATGSSIDEVKYITIDNVEYKLAGSGSGSEVIANPEEEATDTLTTIKINEKVYDLGVGGLSVAVEKINNKNTLTFNNNGPILPSNDKPIVVALGTNASSLTAIPLGAKKLIIIAGQSNFDEFEGVAVVDLQELNISGVSLEVEKEWFNKIDIYSTMDEAQNNDTFTKVTDSQYKYYWKDSNNSNYGTITIMIYSNIMFTITNSFGTNSAIVYWE